MGTRNYHLMNHPDKKDEGFIKVNLNEWGGKRRQGYVFVTTEEEAEEKLRMAEVAEKEAPTKGKAKNK